MHQLHGLRVHLRLSLQDQGEATAGLLSNYPADLLSGMLSWITFSDPMAKR
jgi:hypothetical protein